MREDPTFDTIRMLNGFKPFLRHHYSSINTSCGGEHSGMIVAEFFPRNHEVEYYRMSFSSVMRLGCWLARREILFRDFSTLRIELNVVEMARRLYYKWMAASIDDAIHKSYTENGGDKVIYKYVCGCGRVHGGGRRTMKSGITPSTTR